jgi:hypothetical protein
VVEEAGEDFEGDRVLQVGGRHAAGMRDDFGDHGQSLSSLTTPGRASLLRRIAQ